MKGEKYMNYTLLKKFVLRLVGGEEVETTVNVKEVEKWLENLKEDEYVVVFITDGTFTDYKYVEKVWQLNKWEILVRNYDKEFFLLKGVDNNRRNLELDYYSLNPKGKGEAISQVEAMNFCKNGKEV